MGKVSSAPAANVAAVEHVMQAVGVLVMVESVGVTVVVAVI